MKREFYESPKGGYLMRLFWKAAGGDRYILERATYSDQIKYMCLGGIVVSTGLMAALAGGYAFYTIFEPRGSAIQYSPSSSTAAISIVFGIVWGLIIFNIDRFIVTSTGKGDGTEAITWEEFKSAIPRIILGAIIALTISKPVEIKMFKTEIDIELRGKQLEKQLQYQTHVDSIFRQREMLIDSSLMVIQASRQNINERVIKAEQEYYDQLQGRAGAPAGDGKLAAALKAQYDHLYSQLVKFDIDHKIEILNLGLEKNQLKAEKEKERKDDTNIANGLDGLLERIKLSHQIAGFWITLFITLLFMAIELTPIFFKLMLVKTPYDYLSENRDELLKADQGIEVKYDYYEDKKGLERHLIIHHGANKLIYEKIKLTEIQKLLTDYAAEKYVERERKKIDDNIDSYIKDLS